MRQTMAVRLSQQLTMTPRLVQSIQMLMWSGLELEQQLRAALDTNVMLEADTTEDDASATGDDDNWERPQSGHGEAPDIEDRPVMPMARLMDQLPGAFPAPGELAMAVAILDRVDDAGYLAADLADIAADDPSWSVAQLEAVLTRVQRLEPAGIGARSLAECLTCQLESLPRNEPGRIVALVLVADYLATIPISTNADLAQMVGVTADEITTALALIRSLDPKPGAETSIAELRVPELRIEGDGNDWHVRLLESDRTQLRVNAAYEGWLKGCGESRGASAMRDQLREARWLLRSVAMRRDTLLRTAEAIFARQRDFLDRGETALRPMTLREIAEAIDMHESSISRVVRNKTVETPHGTFDLRYFFSAQVGGQACEGVCGNGVKAMVQDMIDGEDRARPLCDGDVAAALARRGIKVARRTIAKYRGLLGIPPAAERFAAC